MAAVSKSVETKHEGIRKRGEGESGEQAYWRLDAKMWLLGGTLGTAFCYGELEDSRFLASERGCFVVEKFEGCGVMSTKKKNRLS